MDKSTVISQLKEIILRSINRDNEGGAYESIID